MNNITDDEMRLLAGRMKDSLEKANKVFTLFDNIIKGGPDDEFEYNDEIIESINMRVKKALTKAVNDGVINIPSGRVINEIFINDDGELIIEYRDV